MMDTVGRPSRIHTIGITNSKYFHKKHSNKSGPLKKFHTHSGSLIGSDKTRILEHLHNPYDNYLSRANSDISNLTAHIGREII